MTVAPKALCICFMVTLAALTAGFSRAAVIVFNYNPHIALYQGLPSQAIDFNGDSIPEIVLSADSTQSGGWVGFETQVQAIPATPPNLGSWATPLISGGVVSDIPSSIGIWTAPTADSFTFRIALAEGSAGYWPTGLTNPPLNPDGTLGTGLIVPDSGYLGVRFNLPDGWHYGWVEVGVYPNSSASFLRSYGWETNPNTPIFAGSTPEPSRSMFILLGAIFLSCRRRRALGSG